jgi:hypothetical protein
MLVIGRENWRHQMPWCIAAVVATVAAAAGYVACGLASGRWTTPGGGSPLGFALGLIGGLIIGIEMLLWPRKSLWRRHRLGRTKTWMTAHIWLGLLTIPLLLMHGGFNFNLSTSTLAALLMWLLVAVVGSGVFGLAMQNIVPRLMLEQVPSETIYGQIEHVLRQYRAEAARLVEMTCGRSRLVAKGESEQAVVAGAVQRAQTDAPVGSMRQPRASQANDASPAAAFAAVPESDDLFIFYCDQIEPYLRARSARRASLGSEAEAKAIFEALRDRLPRKAHDALDQLESLCNRRRQFDLQTRLHFWLHWWLGLHVALSVALTLLMIVHAVLALKYS